MAGSDREPVRDQIVAWATTCRLAEHIRIVPDASLLLASIPTSEPAAALIAGTGSLALARDAQGRTARAGGWGPLIGDEGSAYWVARQALQAVVRAADGRRQPTELTAPLLEACCPGRPILDLPAAVAAMDRSRLAALAPIVTRTAEAGDSAAAEIVGQAAEHLAEMVWAALQQLELECIPVELVLTGGLLAGSTWMQRELARMLVQQNVDVKSQRIMDHPVSGAVELAAQAFAAQGFPASNSTSAQDDTK
jgi:N-acetylglucosamine kinase-like BadF-type ATPase